MTSTEKKNKSDAPFWVNQIADSLIKIAAAFVIIGIDVGPYFEAKRDISIFTDKLEVLNSYGLLPKKFEEFDEEFKRDILGKMEEFEKQQSRLLENSHPPAKRSN